MTGELTLSGKVLPIGGLKEKLIAAYKAKMKKALVPRKNFERDLEDILTEPFQLAIDEKNPQTIKMNTKIKMRFIIPETTIA